MKPYAPPSAHYAACKCHQCRLPKGKRKRAFRTAMRRWLKKDED